jgi:hypothetical protein
VILKPQTVDDLGFLVIEDLYSAHELKFVWNEINHIDYVLDVVFDDNAKEEHKKSHNGVNEQGVAKMSGFGLSLDSFFSDRKFSAILKYSDKLMSEEVANAMGGINGENKAYSLVNWHFTLLNKYKSGEVYTKHQDSSSFSVIVFLSKGEIQGGGLEFCDYNITVPFKNNSCVIFPSRAYHQTESFSSNSERYSIVQFKTVKYYMDRNAGY